MSRSHSILSSLILSSVGGIAAGCYGFEFDHDRSGVYYCQTDDDCPQDLVCATFRCLADDGPKTQILDAPAGLSYPSGTSSLPVRYDIDDLTISESSERVEGQGMARLSIHGTQISILSSDASNPSNAQLDISSLPPGAHRLRVEAVYGDGTPYENPSASAYTVFFIEDQNQMRPQVAIVEPGPDQVHRVGQPLVIRIVVDGFTLVPNGPSCLVDPSCDPWGQDGANCWQPCLESPEGHAHVYALDDYPGCLNNMLPCNGDYLMWLRPGADVDTSDISASATIPGDRFTEAGPLTLSVGLQENEHQPFPNANFVVHDQLIIDVQ